MESRHVLVGTVHLAREHSREGRTCSFWWDEGDGGDEEDEEDEGDCVAIGMHRDEDLAASAVVWLGHNLVVGARSVAFDDALSLSSSSTPSSHPK